MKIYLDWKTYKEVSNTIELIKKWDYEWEIYIYRNPELQEDINNLLWNEYQVVNQIHWVDILPRVF